MFTFTAMNACERAHLPYNQCFVLFSVSIYLVISDLYFICADNNSYLKGLKPFTSLSVSLHKPHPGSSGGCLGSPVYYPRLDVPGLTGTRKPGYISGLPIRRYR